MSSYGDDLFAKDIVASNDVKCNKVEATTEVKAKTVEATGTDGAVKCAKLGVGDKRGNPGAPSQNITVDAAAETEAYVVPAKANLTGTPSAANINTAINALGAVVHGIVLELQKTGVLKSS